MAAETQPEAATGGFEAIIEVDALDALFESVNTLVDECKLHLNETGVVISAIDPANVAMCDAVLDAEAFETYRADGGTIGLNVDRMLDVLNIADSGDLVTLYTEPETRKLVIRIEEGT